MVPTPPRTVLLPLLLAIVILALLACRADDRSSLGSPIPLSLAVRPGPDAALIAIAQDQGYFKRAGLALSLSLQPSGLEAMNALGRGEAQLATVSDAAFAVQAMQDPTLRVLGAIGATTAGRIVARKDRGIRTPWDLKGKRVGYTAGTTSDYFLYAFLLTEDIAPAEITLVDLAATQQAEAVVQGEVDAVSAFAANAFAAEQRMGQSALYWDCQNNLTYHWLLVTRQAIAPSHEALRRLFEALLRAEDFGAGNDARVRAILVDQWHLEPELLKTYWPQTRRYVSLGQSVVTCLRTYSQWWLGRNDPDRPPVDLLAFLDYRALEQAAPQRVSIFR
jgi:NitT/TauT family transport system substrate-binding protein